MKSDGDLVRTEAMKTHRISFAGLGIMGGGMARNFLTRCYPLAVWDRTRPVADLVAAEGGPCGRQLRTGDCRCRPEVFVHPSCARIGRIWRPRAPGGRLGRDLLDRCEHPWFRRLVETGGRSGVDSARTVCGRREGSLHSPDRPQRRFAVGNA
jgi:hypothetical protein